MAKFLFMILRDIFGMDQTPQHLNFSKIHFLWKDSEGHFWSLMFLRAKDAKVTAFFFC